ENVVSSLGVVGELATAVKNRDYWGTAGALADLADHSIQVRAVLAQLLQRYITSGQVDTFFSSVSTFLGDLLNILNLYNKYQLLLSLTESTFNAPPQTWNRLDTIATIQT